MIYGLHQRSRFRKYEDKYKVPSDVFVKNFSAEDLKGGDEEYIRWTGELKIKKRVLEDLHRLKNITYVIQVFNTPQSLLWGFL